MSAARTIIRMPAQGGQSNLASWVAGDLANAYARLYINNPVYDPEMTVAAFVEASWGGYSPQLLAPWDGPTDLGGGVVELKSRPIIFEFLLAAGMETAFGFIVTDALFTKLLLVQQFVTPVTFTARNKSLQQVVSLLTRSQV